MTDERKELNIFDKNYQIDEEKMSVISLNPIEIKVQIDRSMYKNVALSYGEVLKEMFGHKKVYCLTKIKENKNISNIVAILFKNSKKAVMSEMKSFAPSFLIKGDNRDLLVVEKMDEVQIYEVEVGQQRNFVHRGYRYKIANEIELK